jgi:hypothetical protein
MSEPPPGDYHLTIFPSTILPPPIWSCLGINTPLDEMTDISIYLALDTG